jgi:hypothetical protein
MAANASAGERLRYVLSAEESTRWHQGGVQAEALLRQLWERYQRAEFMQSMDVYHQSGAFVTPLSRELQPDLARTQAVAGQHTPEAMPARGTPAYVEWVVQDAIRTGYEEGSPLRPDEIERIRHEVWTLEMGGSGGVDQERGGTVPVPPQTQEQTPQQRQGEGTFRETPLVTAYVMSPDESRAWSQGDHPTREVEQAIAERLAKRPSLRHVPVMLDDGRTMYTHGGERPLQTLMAGIQHLSERLMTLKGMLQSQHQQTLAQLRERGMEMG